MKRFSLRLPLILLTLNVLVLSGQNPAPAWIDSVYQSLTPDQRIAQLLVVRVWPWKDSTYCDSIAAVIGRHNVGGVCFFKGSPVKQALLTNRLQSVVQTPLLVTTDAAWGLGMRMDSALSFPRQMALGALGNDSLIYEMGREVGRQCKRMGIRVNFAPVADVNNNPDNPVIGFRSFGEDPEIVAEKSARYMKGMQDEGIMAVAKHFPGHGDTGSDSHYTLPVILHDRRRLDSVELLPFRRLIRDGVQGVMIAHLYLPTLDTAQNTPSTLSNPVVTGLLKKELSFGGYVITDALDMQGVTRFFPPGEIEVRAIQAGNDILLLPQDIDSAVAGIRAAIDSGRIDSALVETLCRKMLALKYRLGLAHRQTIDTAGLVADLNAPAAVALCSRMTGASMTLVKNDLLQVPLSSLGQRRIASLALGTDAETVFQRELSEYAPVRPYNLPRRIDRAMADSILRELASADLVLLSLHNVTSNAADTFGLGRDILLLTDTLSRINRTVLTLFGTPYALDKLTGPRLPEAVLVAYQDNPFTQKAAAQVLFGGTPGTGKLPVTAGTYPAGTGETTAKTRLESITPEEAGIPSNALRVIDSIAEEGIVRRAYPGCQVLLARNGKVFYHKAFGHPRYGDTAAVEVSTLYDLASVTKVAATTLAVMKLSEEGKIRLSDTLGRYLPRLKGTNKAGLRIDDVMAHQAGLQDWIPFYKATLRVGRPDPAIYRDQPEPGYRTRVAEGLWIRDDYSDTIYARIAASPLRNNNDYKYSDLGFYILRLVIEQATGQPFEHYLDETFYGPLGLTTMGFRPRERFDLSRVTPTEYDAEWRRELVWGDVHDPGAAMLGGVAGHAGLFSNTRDLAVILQMLLNGGSYGGKQFLTPATVESFTRAFAPGRGNRRGLGFDKPALNPSTDGPSCTSASPASFGHSGFTGTYIWADPSNGLLYVFLSNRICPDASNQGLTKLNIRTNIHQAAYNLLERYPAK